MSVRVLSKVWDGFPDGGTDLLTLLALADWSDDDGRCYPAIPSIAKKIRLGDKQARRIVHRLIESGFVQVTGNDLGGQNSRRYQIVLEKLTPPTSGRPPAEGRTPAGVPSPLPPKGGHPSHSYGRRTVIEPSLTVNTSAASEKSLSAGEKSETARQEKTKAIALADSGDWVNITDDNLSLWGKAYPAVDLKVELAGAAAWIIANPSNRKSNYHRFLANWLKRTQDKAPRAGGSASSTDRTYI